MSGRINKMLDITFMVRYIKNEMRRFCRENQIVRYYTKLKGV